jgi:hypothetical protein
MSIEKTPRPADGEPGTLKRIGMATAAVTFYATLFGGCIAGSVSSCSKEKSTAGQQVQQKADEPK